MDSNKDKDNRVYDMHPICAPATPQGSGAIAIIRLSGENCIKILNDVFTSAGGKKDTLMKLDGYKMALGTISDEKELLDEVMVSVFHAPHSYTGEESAEIYCHCSSYIIEHIIMLLISKGIKMAEPGEFSKRAFLNGKMDLAQSEAVADLIASETEAAHKVALDQMRGGFSAELKELRSKLLHVASLLELELDFSGEDVEFADRKKMKALLRKVEEKVDSLTESFSLGNAIKNGVPVAIIGSTNTGKSTLLNTLLGEEKAIVSNIEGTTRDSIEDTMNIGGTMFRFIDTAGIRDTRETIEIIGIERTFSKLKQAEIVIMVLDATRPEYFKKSLATLSERLDKSRQRLIILINKADEINPDFCIDKKNTGNKAEEHARDSYDPLGKLLSDVEMICSDSGFDEPEGFLMVVLPVSAKLMLNMDKLKTLLINSQKNKKIKSGSTLVTNIRHYQALKDARKSLDRVDEGLKDNLPTDLIAQDVRETIYHLGSIVGEISSQDVLENIFGHFCIGK